MYNLINTLQDAMCTKREQQQQNQKTQKINQNKAKSELEGEGNGSCLAVTYGPTHPSLAQSRQPAITHARTKHHQSKRKRGRETQREKQTRRPEREGMTTVWKWQMPKHTTIHAHTAFKNQTRTKHAQSTHVCKGREKGGNRHGRFKCQWCPWLVCREQSQWLA